GEIRRLALAGLGSFAELALRFFAAHVLPPFFDGRARSAPEIRHILSGPASILEGANEPKSCFRVCNGRESTRLLLCSESEHRALSLRSGGRVVASQSAFLSVGQY